MLLFSSIISNQIRFSLQSLNDSNFADVFRELCQPVSFGQFVEYGNEGSILLLQTCLDHMNFHGGDIQSMQLKPDFLAALFRYFLGRPNFSTVFCEALRTTVINEGFLGDLCNALHLSVSEKIGIGLALSDSEDLDIRMTGQSFCMAQIEELCANPASIDSHEQIQNILMFLHQSEGLAKHVDSFMQILSLLQLKGRNPFILDPLLSDDLHEANVLRNLDLFYECSENDFDAVLAEMEKETSMADIMKELGYGCTINASHCKEILSLFLPLTEVTISRILSTIAHTYTGLEDSHNTYLTFCSALGSNSSSDSLWLSSWNVDVLVDSINQLAPGTDWVHVMENLDHDGFYFPNEGAFCFFMSVYAHACQDQFPLHAICGSVWKNAEGQLSFLRYAVSAPPEMFTFTHSARQLAYADAVHGHKLSHGHANYAWLCLDLLEVLCQLAERGHAGSVRSILEYPLKHCPEVLLLGMAQINAAFNLILNEVSSTVFPMIVGNAMGSGMILHLWHANPNIVLRGFVDIHNTDPDNMTRILGICQELKVKPGRDLILSSVLEMTPFSFSIRLAALASRKEQINLDKWLNDNLSTYRDIFFEECLKFLKEIPIDAAQDVSGNPFERTGAVENAYWETSSILLKVLQAHTGQITSHQLSEEMTRLHVATTHANPRLQNGGATDSSASDRYADDIEAEANSYFNQIFNGQLTIDAAVQMLARFKESSEKRKDNSYVYDKVTSLPLSLTDGSKELGSQLDSGNIQRREKNGEWLISICATFTRRSKKNMLIREESFQRILAAAGRLAPLFLKLWLWWIIIFGIPLHAWCKDTMKKLEKLVAGFIGIQIVVEGKDLEVAKLSSNLVLTLERFAGRRMGFGEEDVEIDVNVNNSAWSEGSASYDQVSVRGAENDVEDFMSWCVKMEAPVPEVLCEA
ncbi:hypothetical protein HHK36_028651 [Tetracentron sinense]|uniref:Uncharacterized protein n=1 Tax=Tetracentron sinense TaxID=13715 RepID=A0A834YBS5_TETSI|nr:hypothetical protein HHK36_028651 [Tetracentron sinense]